MKYAIRKAEARDIPVMTALWMHLFGDPEAYVSLFYRENFERLTGWVRTEDDVPIGMMHLMPCTVANGKTELPGVLGYAGGLWPEYRKKGLFRDVFLTAFAECDEKKQAVIFNPANSKLIEYYKTLGMEDNACWKRETVIADERRMCAVPFEPLNAEAYGELRNEAFSGMPYLKWNTPHIAWSIMENAFCGGETVGFSAFGRKQFAMLGPQNDGLRIVETSLSPEECREFAPVLLEHYRCKKLTAVFPDQFDGTGVPVTITRNCPFDHVYPNLLMI